jgi:ornithine cyclodeaminase/alanine dehydrogenase-like protein (mu-crystallin family)
MLIQSTRDYVTVSPSYFRADPWGIRPTHNKVSLSSRDIGLLVREALLSSRDGTAYGCKSVLTPQPEELSSLIAGDTPPWPDGTERLNWKLSTLIAVNNKHGAVKIVGSNAYNRLAHRARSQSTLLVFDKLSMRPLCIMDGTGISAARTGAYASIVADTYRASVDGLRVFVFGSGAVASRAIADLMAHCGARLDRIFVKAHTEQSVAKLVDAFCTADCTVVAGCLGDLSTCHLIITATNAAEPLFELEETAGDAVVVHLGGDETAPAVVRETLRLGTAACDDVAAVTLRGSQSLALYFSRQGLSLNEEKARYGVANFYPDMPLPAHAASSRCLVTCVGLATLDLRLAERVHDMCHDGDA